MRRCRRQRRPRGRLHELRNQRVPGSRLPGL